MITVKAVFDGRVFIPQEPVPLPAGCELEISVTPASPSPAPSPAEKKPALTAADLLQSGLVGLWADRADLGDSREFARRLREQAQARRRQG